MKKYTLALLLIPFFLIACKDKDAPIIKLNAGDMELCLGTAFIDPGVVVRDNKDGAVAVTSTNNIDNTLVGAYTVRYTAQDAAGNVSNATRVVKYNALLLSGHYDTEIEVSYLASQYNKLYFSKLAGCDNNASFSNAGIIIDKNSFVFDKEYSYSYWWFGYVTVTTHSEKGKIKYGKESMGQWRIEEMTYKVKVLHGNTQTETTQTITMRFSD